MCIVWWHYQQKAKYIHPSRLQHNKTSLQQIHNSHPIGEHNLAPTDTYTHMDTLEQHNTYLLTCFSWQTHIHETLRRVIMVWYRLRDMLSRQNTCDYIHLFVIWSEYLGQSCIKKESGGWERRERTRGVVTMIQKSTRGGWVYFLKMIYLQNRMIVWDGVRKLVYDI